VQPAHGDGLDTLILDAVIIHPDKLDINDYLSRFVAIEYAAEFNLTSYRIFAH
jgi:hypothetical protein